ncbi:18316_t:CDS:2 [Dentiscutata erythropus]|uniref:18316_t:CDS:1 n=1 Tax=Dentiscutata erythropus TaxID=1348616 RepID=A0A9N8YZ19_9GLOM|nr:18316_t:CDS:2 [Dentiscutata erythropus]
MVKVSKILVCLVLIIHVHFTTTLPTHLLEERNLTTLLANISRHKLEKRIRFTPGRTFKRPDNLIRPPNVFYIESPFQTPCTLLPTLISFCICCSLFDRDVVIDDPPEVHISEHSSSLLERIDSLETYRDPVQLAKGLPETFLIHRDDERIRGRSIGEFIGVLDKQNNQHKRDIVKRAESSQSQHGESSQSQHGESSQNQHGESSQSQPVSVPPCPRSNPSLERIPEKQPICIPNTESIVRKPSTIKPYLIYYPPPEKPILLPDPHDPRRLDNIAIEGEYFSNFIELFTEKDFLDKTTRKYLFLMYHDLKSTLKVDWDVSEYIEHLYLYAESLGQTILEILFTLSAEQLRKFVYCDKKGKKHDELR